MKEQRFKRSGPVTDYERRVVLRLLPAERRRAGGMFSDDSNCRAILRRVRQAAGRRVSRVGGA